jgi:hypothetical protein
MDLRDVCLHFPTILYSDSNQCSYQNYCGVTLSSFLKTHGQFLDESDVKNILIQTFIATQVYGDLSGYLRIDTHTKNYCVEVAPVGLEFEHSYYFQFSKDEFFEITFRSPYYVWIIDFSSDKNSTFYFQKTTFVGSDTLEEGSSKKTRSYSHSSTKTKIESQTSGIL